MALAEGGSVMGETTVIFMVESGHSEDRTQRTEALFFSLSGAMTYVEEQNEGGYVREYNAMWRNKCGHWRAIREMKVQP